MAFYVLSTRRGHLETKGFIKKSIEFEWKKKEKKEKRSGLQIGKSIDMNEMKG